MMQGMSLTDKNAMSIVCRQAVCFVLFINQLFWIAADKINICHL